MDVDAIEQALKEVSSLPGVYRMYDIEGETLYIGKAKNLQKRLRSYFNNSLKSVKTDALVAKIAKFETTITHSETEALLLEQTLIKQLKPPFNILLRDDKSYPFIFLSTKQAFPRLCYHRGAQREKGLYFGPYPSAHAVRESLNLLQKLFKVRQCDDVFFKNRSRPCLQYQIKRCSAPCVNHITTQDYSQAVNYTQRVLEGKDQEVIEELVHCMESASTAQEYESAAGFRDQIRALRHVQETQFVDGDESLGDLDVIGLAVASTTFTVSVVSIRGGQVMGSKQFALKSAWLKQAERCEDTDEPTRSMEVVILEEFLSQFYCGAVARPFPKKILIERAIPDFEQLSEWLSTLSKQRAQLLVGSKAEELSWLKMARLNAQKHLDASLSRQQSSYHRFLALQQSLSLDECPSRMECFDISHTSGQNTVASCVVFDHDGPKNQDYRLFNIEGIKPGDDYAAMAQVLGRRYTRIKQGTVVKPDILIIDGGKGQLVAAMQVLKELQIDQLYLLGIAKGPTRRAGLEQIFLVDLLTEAIKPVQLDSAALHLVQHIRDESHRFAIAGHRARRKKKQTRSSLEEIPGVGPKRRQALLKYFGGLKEVQRASAADLAKAPGISISMAQEIYAHLHE